MFHSYKPDILQNILEDMNKHTGLKLEDLLNQLSKIKMTYDDWQAHLKTYSDEILFYLLLTVDIARIDEATAWHPAMFDIKKMVLEQAQNKLDILLKGGVVMPVQSKAYLFCLLEVYDRIRAQEPEYKSSFAYMGSFLMAGTSQHEKQGFCKLYKEFICSDLKLNEFDLFLKQRSLFGIKSTILERNSRLQLIHTLAKNRGNDLDAEMTVTNERLSYLQASRS